MTNDIAAPGEKCRYCGLDEEHCVCGAAQSRKKNRTATRAKAKEDTCETGVCGEGCACSHAYGAIDRDQEEDEREEKEGCHGAFAPERIVPIGVAVALLLASVFVGGWLQTALRIASYLAAGYEVLIRAATGFVKGRFFDENVLMSVATVGAVVLGDYAEAAAVMIFYGIGESLQEAAVRRSRDRIADAVELHPDKARLVEDGVQRMVRPDEVPVGGTILVKVGERIPLDGAVSAGESLLDVSMLTGEPQPFFAGPGAEVSAGALNTSGPLTIRTTRIAAESSTSRLLRAVEDATRHKPALERFISRFARVYTPSVIAAAVLLAVLPPLFGAGAWNEWIHRALIFLVISCPCALVLSIPLTFFAGLAVSSRAGVLFKGADAFERLPRVKAVVFDKTGTLTEGEFEVQRVESAGMPQEELLALASAAEQHSLHPVASAVARADTLGFKSENVREVAGKGVVATVGQRRVVVGNRAFLEEQGISAESDASVLVAVDGAYAGAIYVGDRLRDTAKAAISTLNETVGYTAILTGDAAAAAQEVGDTLGVKAVFASLQPAEKLDVMRKIRAEVGETLFVGDGINDAPVLAGADVGIAIGLGGTDMAAEAADALLLTHDLTHLPFSLYAAKRTLRKAKSNIAIALGIKTTALVLGALGLAGMWVAILADVGAALICVLNTLTLFSVSKRLDG
ncbi:MAG: cadmium-translocating P-type ATPase [Clostridiales bacterium]|nr:cadmium-translocating P-type ATPase [Clostridiales bacterium]